MKLKESGVYNLNAGICDYFDHSKQKSGEKTSS